MIVDNIKPQAPGNGGPNKRAATLEPTKRQRGRLGPRAGIPKRMRPNCHKRRYSRTSVGIAPKGRGPKDPGVAAPLASAGCRGNRLPAASCVELRWYDMGGRSHTSAFSSDYWSNPSRAILSGPSTPQILSLFSGLMGESSVNGGILWN